MLQGKSHGRVIQFENIFRDGEIRDDPEDGRGFEAGHLQSSGYLTGRRRVIFGWASGTIVPGILKTHQKTSKVAHGRLQGTEELNLVLGVFSHPAKRHAKGKDKRRGP